MLVLSNLDTLRICERLYVESKGTNPAYREALDVAVSRLQQEQDVWHQKMLTKVSVSALRSNISDLSVKDLCEEYPEVLVED